MPEPLIPVTPTVMRARSCLPSARCGWGLPLISIRPSPAINRSSGAKKGLSVSVRRDSAGNAFYACHSSMNDTVHDITVEFDLAPDGVISNARSTGLRLPYHGICEDAQLRTARLNGMRANRRLFYPIC